ncbi:dirigent protein 15-like [Vicia villosa]|uniref:dirigent protein 15-like n=1 Tax=Vicia villosa TaxID=3911 RepID=UPI00273A9684|nr:dirigent protein 15-like [Vicia villosa]
MENKSIFIVLALFLCSITIPVQSEYHSEGNIKALHLKEKVTHLHFYLFDILSGKNPSAVQIAQPNITLGASQSATPFGHLYAIDDPLKDGPNETSNVIGNAQGLYLSSSKSENLTLVLYVDFGFTTGKFKGSSLSLFSRNPVTEPKPRELAIVGGRGKFRLARGYAKVKTHFLDFKNGDAILEYDVTVLHY